MKYDSFYDEGQIEVNEQDIEFDEIIIPEEPYFEYDKRRISYAFTGHRTLSDEEKKSVLPRLKGTVLYLISQGVKDFHCGGAIGFDTLAASIVFDVSREHRDVRLILDIPYENQTQGWNETNKRFYNFLKSKAHEINIHGKNPSSRNDAIDSLLRRNRSMIDKSHYCVCFLRDENAKKGGTAYTVNYAKLLDSNIINLATESEK